MLSTGLTWHPLPSDPTVLNRILDAAMMRRDATVEDALRTAEWRIKTKASPSLHPIMSPQQVRSPKGM